MPNDYYLVDLTHNNDAILKQRLYSVAAKIALKYGYDMSKITEIIFV